MLEPAARCAVLRPDTKRLPQGAGRRTPAPAPRAVAKCPATTRPREVLYRAREKRREHGLERGSSPSAPPNTGDNRRSAVQIPRPRTRRGRQEHRARRPSFLSHPNDPSFICLTLLCVLIYASRFIFE